MDDVPDPIRQISDALQDWPSIPKQQLAAMDGGQILAIEGPLGLETTEATDSTIKIAFQNLFQAFRYRSQRRIASAMENICSLAFFIRTFSPVSAMFLPELGANETRTR